MSVWTFNGFQFTLDEIISTHKCNEKDKSILSQNFESIEPAVKSGWPLLYCLDNPEKIKLRQLESSSFDNVSLWVEAFYCRGQDHCKSEEEIWEWKEVKKMFTFVSNTKQYQPNDYGNEMVIEDPAAFF